MKTLNIVKSHQTFIVHIYCDSKVANGDTMC